jgi:uncharacterized protein (DUF1684 family)
MCIHSRLVGAATLILMGCTADWPEPPPVATEVLLAEHEDWRSNRERRLVTPPGGSVLWNGLWEIPEGETQFGSDPSLVMSLPAEDSPPIAGMLRRAGPVVTLIPNPASGIRLRTPDPDDNRAVIETLITEPLVLENDRSGKTTRITLGSLGMRVHKEPGSDRLWLRSWDEDAAIRETFALPDYFPVSQDWRVAARFEEYNEPRILHFADVTGGLVEFRAPGELVFEVDGREHSLIATASLNSRSFFIIMWDSTATVNTYQGGRFLSAPMPDESGWTTIDFNRAYNAPCVFTEYSVCAVPPLDNWLGLHVTAGEQRPEKATYER